MKSKEEAQEFEDRLLKKYDYPWNQKRNGRRRPEDVHEMLDRCVKERESFHSKWAWLIRDEDEGFCGELLE